MSQIEPENIMELRTIPDLMKMNFFIPEYQRGYRWESKQVNQLLNDLLAYFKSDDKAAFYCLQPIVVKRCDEDTIKENNLTDEEWFEVIDGQQRLTTIRIICAIYDSIDAKPRRHKYSIRYSTRPDMDNIYETLEAPYDENAEKNILKIAGKEHLNLDSVYIYNAANVIVDWFNKEEARKNLFGSHFFNSTDQDKSVRVVWYEDCGNKDARDIFNELNDLTVKLSCSELIRSLFLSSVTEYDCSINLTGVDDGMQKKLKQQDKENHQRYINTKWDEIEHRLTDKRMQSFITNRKSEGLRNNIEILFDLISEKNIADDVIKKDPLYTFIYFNDEIEKIGASKMWQIVEEYYSRLCGWMENRDYYHMIGYLNAITADDSTIIELLDFAKNNNKGEMRNELIRRIRESVKTKNGIQLSSLDYQKKDDYTYIRRLLFLYNVELNRRMKTQDNFPFELFKPLNSWTLEHIHAQNSECLPFDNRAVWEEWSRDNAATLKTLRFRPEDDEIRLNLINELEKAEVGFKTKNKDYNYRKVISLFDSVANFYNKVSTDNESPVKPKPVHQLSNMALLSQEVNTSIGCSAFAVKRLSVIALRNKGYYFPFGTMNVFQKSYSKNQQLYEWSYQDRRSYMASIVAVLRRYLTID